MGAELLPQNATAWEQAVADAIDGTDVVAASIARIRTAKLVDPPSDFIPFLIYEYGLGELTPYVPNLYRLLQDGVRWQRLRGTHTAVALGLGWLGIQASIEEARAARRFWNAFQLHFTALPAPGSLTNIEGVSTLSVPLRSKLRRGTFEYDVRAIETDQGRIDQRRLDGDSGIRLQPERTLWSFGRTTEIGHLLTEAEGTAIGNWLEPPEAETLPTWLDLDVPWHDVDSPWGASAVFARAVAMAAFFSGRTLYQLFRGPEGIIGYRRARVVRPVTASMAGAYEFGGTRLAPYPGGFVYIEAMTDFDDVAAVGATQTSIVVGGSRAAGVPPGRLWLRPGQLSGGHEIAVSGVSLPMHKTVRERIKTLLRF